MKITVKVDNQSYEVEISDVYQRPVVATVNGERFEVWPEETGRSPAAAPAPRSAPQATPAAPPAVSAPAAAPLPSGGRVVHAPIPGVIISVAVKAGDVIAHGQELCVLEAMKMKNVIRATRAGTLAQVLVHDGQHVKHHDVLMEFAE